MKFIDEYRDADLTRKLLADLQKTVTRPWTLMEVCGGQTHSIIRSGLDQMLPQEINLIHGPGCPVCAGPAPIETVYQGQGCAKCRNTGYAGRIGVFELFVPDDELLDAVSRGATLQELRRLTRASGAGTLRQDGLEKVKAGLTTLEELISSTVD